MIEAATTGAPNINGAEPDIHAEERLAQGFELGGRLWVERQPGAGATFSFTLPVEQAGA